ncbi:hypothetical protein D3C87_1448400 [compost metagenome]
MCVPVAGAGRGHIHGKHQVLHPGGPGTLQRVSHEAPVFQHIQLKPEGLLALTRDFLDRTHRYRRQAQRNAFVLRGFCGLHFTPTGEHARQADRRQNDRHCQRLVEEGGFKAQGFDVFQNALTQADVGQVGAVGPQRMLRISAAIDVVE